MADTIAAVSGLSPADLAVSRAMGIRPVGLAQGYYRGHLLPWEKFKATAVYRYECPHTKKDQNPGWVGIYHDVDNQWIDAFNAASDRLRDDARKMGAHGIIGCHTEMAETGLDNQIEAHLYGTAVVVEGAEPLPNGAIWSTSLAGQRLANLVSCGYVPSDVWYGHTTVAISNGCVMEAYGRGNSDPGHVVAPVRDALALVRRSIVNGIRDSKTHTAVHDLRQTIEEEEEELSSHLVCTSYGDRVREVRGAIAPYPASTLSLA